MWFLFASVAVLAIGPLSYRAAARARRALRILDVAVVATVAALVLLHILPETIERVGWVAFVPMLVGLLGPTLVERGLAAIERHAHVVLVGLVLVGLGIHAVMDGIALVLPTEDEGWLGMSLPVAVVLHRVPVSLLIWWLLRPAYGVWAAGLALGIEGLGAVVGFVGAQHLLPYVDTPVVGAMQAFVAGSMLHVMVDRRDHRTAHAH